MTAARLANRTVFGVGVLALAYLAGCAAIERRRWRAMNGRAVRLR